jgi:hypothetical protein
MSDVAETSCELRVSGWWQPTTLDEALELNPDRLMRCPVCHGRVRARHAENGVAAHFEHYIADPGCYLVDGFDGNPRPHRRALK